MVDTLPSVSSPFKVRRMSGLSTVCFGYEDVYIIILHGSTVRDDTLHVLHYVVVYIFRLHGPIVRYDTLHIQPYEVVYNFELHGPTVW